MVGQDWEWCSYSGFVLQMIGMTDPITSEYLGTTVSKLNMGTGEYSTLYEVPINVTDPPYDRINACAVSAYDEIVYCFLRFLDDTYYLVRVDQNGVRVLRYIHCIHLLVCVPTWWGRCM